MQKPSSLAKITRPAAKGAYLRKRLFGLLDESRDTPCIWVGGPPGSGKTTLISSYIDSLKVPCLWYRLDEGDGDIATFFYYMRDAARKLTPRKKKQLPLFTPEYQLGVTVYARRFFEELYGRQSPPYAVVFDNYHAVPKESRFHEIMNIALSVVPEGVKVILISRSGPNPAFAGMRANRLMGHIGWDNLRLRPDESEGIVKRYLKGGGSPGSIEKLHKSAHGWAAGLMLMLETAKTKGVEPIAPSSDTKEGIFEYFAGEIFERTDSGVQDFLLKTSFLPDMTASMAGTLADSERASQILSDLSRRNYFIEKRPGQLIVYQYHPLFREFLLSCAGDKLENEEISKLQIRAGGLLEEAGRIEEAVRLFGEAGDVQSLTSLIQKHALALVFQGRHKVLETWLNVLPEEEFQKNPWLTYWLGISRIPFSPLQSTAYLEESYNRFKSLEDTNGIFLSWAGVVESIAFGFDDYRKMDPLVAEMSQIMRKHKSFPTDAVGARVSAGMTSALGLRQPWHPELEEWVDRALRLTEIHGDVTLQTRALHLLMFYRLYTGDFAKARLVLDKIEYLRKSSSTTTMALLTVKASELLYHTFTGSYEKSLQIVLEGLEMADNSGIHVWDFLFLGNGARNALSAGDYASARKFIDKMKQSPDILRFWDKAVYHIASAYEAMLSGELKSAAQHIDTAMELASKVGVPVNMLMCNLVKAHIMNEMKRDEEAERHLKEAAAIARKINSRLFEFACLLAEAQFLFDRQEKVKGISALKKAFALGREHDYTHVVHLWRSDVMARLCTVALENGIETAYAISLIRRRNLVPEVPPVHLENWPWQLKVNTLGKFEIIRDGEPVRFSGKAQQRPVEMLKALIALGGSDVKEESITDVLWPEADGDAAHSAFTTTLSRLRKLIGNEDAIQFQNGRATLTPSHCWVDLWAFERLMSDAEAAWQKPDDGMVQGLADKALALYGGEFLAQDDEHWKLSTRERLNARLIRNTVRLGRYWEERSAWDKGAECYQKGIEIDEYAEESYQRLLTCYHRLGRRGDALALYDRYQKSLMRTFGAEPSAQTSAIYDSILKDDRQ